MQSKRLIVLGILSIVALNDALRVLVMFPLPSKSHSILGQGVVTNLLKAGHEVVHFTSFPRDKPVANLTEINVEPIMQKIIKEQMPNRERFKLKNMIGKSRITENLFVLYFSYMYHKEFLEDNIVVDFLSDRNQKFDAVIVEWFFNEVFSGIGPLFECPLIWLGSTEAHWQILKQMDDIPNPAYSVDIFSSRNPPMTFWERALELLTFIQRYVLTEFVAAPLEYWVYSNVFYTLAEKRGVSMPSYYEAKYSGSIMLLNSHPSIGIPYRLPQNAKYIGGYHIDTEVKPLPQEVKNIMDKAKHGVIYFSMGSNLKSEDMSVEMRDSLFSMFSKLQQTVLWKFETDVQSKIPSNVHLLKWAPQQSILAHPNLKIFITHGGLLSTTESVHYGVPIIGIPVMADQHVNMKSIENKGFGIRVSIDDNVADSLKIAIDQMLSNSTYKEKVKELSAIYHDRILSPGEELLYWVQYAVRTHGAPHLRSPALQLSWYQKSYLDLLALIVAAILLIKTVIKRACCKSSNKELNVKKTN